MEGRDEIKPVKQEKLSIHSSHYRYGIYALNLPLIIKWYAFPIITMGTLMHIKIHRDKIHCTSGFLVETNEEADLCVLEDSDRV